MGHASFDRDGIACEVKDPIHRRHIDHGAPLVVTIHARGRMHRARRTNRRGKAYRVGDDLNEIMSDDIVTERPISCKFQFSSTCEGEHSWRIFLIVASPFAIVGTVLLKELGKDLYHWLKTRVKDVFTRKSNGDGFAVIEFQDLEITIPYHPSEDAFAEVWLELHRALQEIDPTITNSFTAEYDDESRTVKLIPDQRP